MVQECVYTGGGGGNKNSITPNTTTWTSANCGFAPKQVVLYRYSSSGANTMIFHYDFEANKVYATADAIAQTEKDVTGDSTQAVWQIGTAIQRTSNDFQFKVPNANNAVSWQYIAY